MVRRTKGMDEAAIDRRRGGLTFARALASADAALVYAAGTWW